MDDELVCWKCGASLAGLSLPLGRRDECPACGADLHVCRMCRFYDPGVSRACREPVAEPVTDKERANFCGYFEARAGAHRPGDREGGRAARDSLDALFGDGTGSAQSGSSATPGEAKEQLERLFGKPDKDD